jgi:hypothetical protein
MVIRPNPDFVTADGVRYLQEEQPDLIGATVGDFVRTLRNPTDTT